MAETQFTIESLDLENIERETGPHTRDGLNTLYLAANAEAQARRMGVRQAIERMNPKMIISSPAANQDNFDTEFATVIRFDGAASVNVTGFQDRPEPTAIFLCVLGAGTITLKHQDAGSIARNRIVTNSGADLAIATNKMVMLMYLNTRWREMSWV